MNKMVNKNAPNLKDLFQQRKNVFKKAEVFDIDYTPENLVARDEAEDIFSKTLSFLKSRISQHIFIYGGHGCGKTAYSKYIKDQVQGIINENKIKIRIDYLNCRFIRDLWNIPEVLFRNGFGKKDDPIKFLTSNLERDLILILDEIDEADDPSDFLYFLSRFQEIQSENKSKIMLILVSNKRGWDKNLDSAARSSLSLRKIEFKQYNKSQIKEILKQRLQIGLVNIKIIGDGVLNEIIERTLESNSDLRIALKALVMIIDEMQEKDKQNISMESLSKIYDSAIKIIQSDRIGQLEDGRFMILYAISLSTSDYSRDIHKAYINLCQSFGIKPWGYTRFLYYVDTLENQGFIEVSFGKKEEEGQKNIIVKKMKLKIKKSVISEEYENRKIKFGKK